jgi:hypothetical protein
LALNREQLLQLARHGAAARIAELQNEISAIEQAFPGLRNGSGPRRRTRARRQTAGATQVKATAANRRGWTAAQRKAAARRMRAYWRKRKANKKD